MHNPRPLFQPTEQIKARFERNVARAEGCWEWRGWRNNHNYGRFTVAGRNYGAHRVAYLIYKGSDPGALLVCHRCDNPPCVNPDHLWLGTHADNRHDMIVKGREGKKPRSEWCKRGHRRTPEGTFPNGACRECRTLRVRQQMLRNIPEYCRVCGHHRTDDYVATLTGDRRCRACNKRRDRARYARHCAAKITNPGSI